MTQFIDFSTLLSGEDNRIEIGERMPGAWQRSTLVHDSHERALGVMASLQTLDHVKVRQVPHEGVRIDLSIGSQKHAVDVVGDQASRIGRNELLPKLSPARLRIEAVDAPACRTFRPRQKYFPPLRIPSNELVLRFGSRHTTRR